MNNRNSKNEYKKQDTFLDWVTAGAAVKTAVDVNDMKNEIVELKRIEALRLRSEEREREKAEEHRQNLNKEQRALHEKVERDLEAQAERRAIADDARNREMAIEEIEEIKRLSLGIHRRHYGLVKEIAITKSISRQEAAKSFRDELVELGLGLLLPEENCPRDQTLEAIKQKFPLFPAELNLLTSILERGFELRQTIDGVYVDYVSALEVKKKQAEELHRELQYEKEEIAVMQQAESNIIAAIQGTVNRYVATEKKIMVSLDRVRSRVRFKLLSRLILIALGSICFVTALRLTFWSDTLSTALTVGIAWSAFVVWIGYHVVTSTDLYSGELYSKIWFANVSDRTFHDLLTHASQVILKKGDPKAPGEKLSLDQEDSFNRALEICSEEGFIFLIIHVLSLPYYEELRLRALGNTSKLPKDRALYLLSKFPSVHSLLLCSANHGVEFLYLLKKEFPKLSEIYLMAEDATNGLPEDDDYDRDLEHLMNIFNDVSSEYSPKIATQLFWIYGYHCPSNIESKVGLSGKM